ncbi:hypothetical protein HOU03_gp070 [Caulobacter phage CcrSC]|uniref:Uncharacterized protein n=1 Tax=Caulobacter phage CcrSC TaxID=2283272 RepID=A0A385EFN3_9CAUD|nr:hypothetical protein HOU03_gp070 [Caulobacter phage CcrSC]AXQ69652.1 hypothetical protein CcrSC_gp070c [Caulobacter phage CcrSC]
MAAENEISDFSHLGGGIGVQVTAVRPDPWQERWRWQPITAYSPGIEPFFGAIFKQKPLGEHKHAHGAT